MFPLKVLLPVLALITAGPAVAGEEVSYSHDGTTMKGYLATPANLSGKAPAVLVVHEWWGANANSEKFGLPLAYDAEVDAASWAEMLKLFDATLR